MIWPGPHKWKTKAKINLSILIFFPTIYLATLKVYTKFEDFALIEAEKSVTKIFIGEKEKWTNNGNDKQEGGWFSLTQYNKLYPIFVPNFKILGSVVPQKSLTKKKFTHKPTHTHTQTLLLKRQKLYTPYILRIPGV